VEDQQEATEFLENVELKPIALDLFETREIEILRCFPERLSCDFRLTFLFLLSLFRCFLDNTPVIMNKIVLLFHHNGFYQVGVDRLTEVLLSIEVSSVIGRIVRTSASFLRSFGFL
jgi:hypothetical protein